MFSYGLLVRVLKLFSFHFICVQCAIQLWPDQCLKINGRRYTAETEMSQLCANYRRCLNIFLRRIVLNTRNVQRGTRPYVSQFFFHFCRCTRAQASNIFDVKLRLIVNVPNVCDKRSKAICSETTNAKAIFFGKTKVVPHRVSYTISRPMLVQFWFRRQNVTWAAKLKKIQCLCHRLYDVFFSLKSPEYFCWILCSRLYFYWLFKQNHDLNNIDQLN